MINKLEHQLSVVLVEPEDGLNIGFVARAMKGFEIQNLRIVYSKKNRIPKRAYRTGARAKEVLDAVKISSSLEEALAEFHEVIAFSRRTFDASVPVVSLPNLKNNMGKKTALVFGRESVGLLASEIVLCNQVCSIPSINAFSFNLGQAVSIALYQLIANRGENDSGELQSINENAKHSERMALVQWIENHCSDSWLEKGNRKNQIREWVQRAQFSTAEMQGVFGLFKELIRKSN